MSAFETLERGVVQNYTYYVARRADGWTRCWIQKNGRNVRRSMSWLRKQKNAGKAQSTWVKES